MNYLETMDHLTNEIAALERCSRTKAHEYLADALNARKVRTLLLSTICRRGDSDAEPE